MYEKGRVRTGVAKGPATTIAPVVGRVQESWRRKTDRGTLSAVSRELQLKCQDSESLSPMGIESAESTAQRL